MAHLSQNDIGCQMTEAVAAPPGYFADLSKLPCFRFLLKLLVELIRTFTSTIGALADGDSVSLGHCYLGSFSCTWPSPIRAWASNGSCNGALELTRLYQGSDGCETGGPFSNLGMS